MNYDVIYDALKLIFDKNLKRLRELGDIGTARILAIYREIV